MPTVALSPGAHAAPGRQSFPETLKGRALSFHKALVEGEYEEEEEAESTGSLFFSCIIFNGIAPVVRSS